MLNFISTTVLASSFALTACCQNASACGSGGCGCAPACAAACEAQPAGPAAPAAKPNVQEAPPAPATAQNSNALRYRSYSYDTAPVYRAPQARSSSRPNSWPQNQFRADRKMYGL
jgi:hypothetical protein